MILTPLLEFLPSEEEVNYILIWRSYALIILIENSCTVDDDISSFEEISSKPDLDLWSIFKLESYIVVWVKGARTILFIAYNNHLVSMKWCSNQNYLGVGGVIHIRNYYLTVIEDVIACWENRAKVPISLISSERKNRDEQLRSAPTVVCTLRGANSGKINFL